MTTSYRPYRVEITGTLRPCAPFHIGTGESLSAATDSPALRERNDPGGPVYIPGTSLRGALRSWLEREAPLVGCGEEHLKTFFGHAGKTSKQTAMGRFQIFDSYPADGAQADVELRDHVRIDERWGAAATGAKFDMETALEHSALFEFRAVYEGDGANDAELRLLNAAISHLRSGEFRTGAKAAWGLGRMTLDPGIQVHVFDRSTDQGLVDYLEHRLTGSAKATGSVPNGPATNPLKAKTEKGAPWNTITLKLRLQFEGPVLVKSALPPAGSSNAGNENDPATYAEAAVARADSTFVQRLAANGIEYYLPGSSLRGVLRHEAIWMAGVDKGRKEMVEKLFGKANESGIGGQAGHLEVEDAKLDGPARVTALDHVAVDRIVQGAADGQKFDTAALASPAFEARVTLRFEASQKELVRWFGALLRRMETGQLWAGSGTARGYGLLRCASIREATVNLVDELGWKLTALDSAPKQENGRTVYRPKAANFAGLSALWQAACTGAK